MTTEGAIKYERQIDPQINSQTTHQNNPPLTAPAGVPLRKVVLGNPALTVQEAIQQFCAVQKLSIPFQIPLSFWLANVIIWLFQIRVAAWDRFCLTYRHFTYQNPVNPRHFQQKPYAETIADLLQDQKV